MWQYWNNKYVVHLLDDGTKLRFGDSSVPTFPESIDIKITDRCDAGCPYCHEGSTPTGKSFDVEKAFELLHPLPKGVEFSFGGGNPLTLVPELKELFVALSGHVCNLTVNAQHLKDFPHSLNPQAVGVSYMPEFHAEAYAFAAERPHTVVHLIAGVHTLHDLEHCCSDFERVLVLGYKRLRRGLAHHSLKVIDNLLQWERNIGHYFGQNILVFDNLALEQLDVRRFFSDDSWKQLYMGDDGQYTMYLDLVTEEYAKSSCSLERHIIGLHTIPEMFYTIRKEQYL
jgi:hypothetical protein